MKCSNPSSWELLAQAGVFFTFLIAMALGTFLLVRFILRRWP